MAASSLHPSSNPFRDPNRTTPISPQPTGASSISLNPFLSHSERISPQPTGVSQYFTPQHTGADAITPQATGAFSPHPGGALNSQDTGVTYNSIPPTPAPEHAGSSNTYTAPSGPPPSHNTPSPNPTPRPESPPQSVFAPPPGPPPQSSYAPPPGPPPPRSPAPAPRAPSPTPSVVNEPPPPYTPAADVRHGEVPLETGPRRAYAPDWHPDGQTWRNQAALSPPPTSPLSISTPVASPAAGRGQTQWDALAPRWTRGSAQQAQSSSSSSRPSAGGSGWSAYPGRQGGGGTIGPPPRHPSGSQSHPDLLGPSPSLGRANTTANTVSRPTPGPPTTVPTPGRALLNRGKVLAYPAGYECNKCHLTGYQAYDPSNPCQQCWSLFAQPYEGILSFAPWDQPESVTSDEQNLQRPLPSSVARPQTRPQQHGAGPSSRPISHPPHSSYGAGSPGGLPPNGWSSSGSSLRPQATVSYSRRPPAGSLVVRPGDPRIGGRVCWKCSGDGWQYKTMGLETKTCSACNGLGRLL